MSLYSPDAAQSMADKAKTDSHLKDLMKVVASGDASRAQLDEFDKLIKELRKESESEKEKEKENALLPKPHPYAGHPAAIPTPDMPSKLLSIPKEIRLEIYRYLLLPSGFISIEPGHPKGDWRQDDEGTSDDWTDEDTISFDGDNSDMEIEYDGSSSMDGLGSILWSMAQPDEDDESIDVDPEYPSNPEAESILNEASQTTPAADPIEILDLEDGGIARRIANEQEMWETGSTHTDFDEYRMYPEILRVNKQIHEEASSVLFTEGTVVVNSNDLFFLSNKSLRWGSIYGFTPWRHNPLTSTAKRLPGGTIQYDQQGLGGWMEPHIFAKFQKVLFDCALEDEHTEGIQFFLDVDTWKLDSEDVAKLRSYLGSLTFVKDFVKLISKSQAINKLTVNLLVEITADTRLDAESIDEDNEEAVEEMDLKQDKADLEANIRATELFMDANMFKPFKQLKNVRRLEFRFGFADFVPAVDYVPAEKYQNMIKKMKKVVEGNFKEPEEPTRGGLRSQGSVTLHESI
ncbi:c8734f15-5419-4037-a2d9-469d1c6dccc4-CDS [Sclerotinia trifoliorum]|uniref:C8734f15-5419-4037-a2d9-469d1c6dccc4-CDS n=1 Tax=Sclerotinia trifoliorum TaxID=28548 RepID=A0A8H2VUU2_9HELO|nr:c8734f15-5419-4037-a2d9-469d1c6dccc4-CDS [Sclerotinia trifoliorum]